jgi:hypothetical protein
LIVTNGIRLPHPDIPLESVEVATGLFIIENAYRAEEDYFGRGYEAVKCSCVVGPIELSDHPSNPKLKIGKIGGRRVVVGNHYDNQVLGFHIPVGAVVPDTILEAMWLKGKLAGSKKNRVKGRAFDGEYSDGLFYGSRYFVLSPPPGDLAYIESPHWNPNWKEGDDVAEELGIYFPDGVEHAGAG